MGFGGNDAGHGEGFQQCAAVHHFFHLNAERGEAVHDLAQMGVGIEMLLEPGQGEFHRDRPPTREGMSSAAKP